MKLLPEPTQTPGLVIYMLYTEKALVGKKTQPTYKIHTNTEPTVPSIDVNNTLHAC